MKYGTINSIFDLMEDTLARQYDLYDDYYEYKKAGNLGESAKVFSLIKAMDIVINEYHQLIVNFVKTDKPRIDDFDDDVKIFLERNNYYSHTEWRRCNYSEELIESLEKDIFADFIHELRLSVIDDNFCSSDKAIQEFINGFVKIDLYLYILSK